MLRVSNRRRLEDLLRASRVAMEALESRILFALPNPIIPTPILPVGTLPLQGIVGTPLSLDPFMFNTAFGFNAINFHLGNSVIHGDGTGQTIAIVDAFGSSTIINDSQVFNDHWGISNRDGQGNFFLTVQPLRPGQNTIGEPADKIAGWALETSLDVEWAHAVAPGAHILLVESPSDSLLDLVDSNVFAANWDTVTQTEDATPNGPGGRGVVVVSNSWGVADFAESFLYDGFFETPTGHLDANGNPGGITFLASSGDVGGQLQYPSASLNVFSVGGQTNSIDLSGNLLTRAPWTGSGGGGTTYTPGWHIPLVSMDADPASGVWIFDSSTPPAGTATIQGGWSVIGGTSLACPAWAAYLSIVDQGRSLSTRPTFVAGQGFVQRPLPSLFSDNTKFGTPDSSIYNIIYFSELGPAGGNGVYPLLPAQNFPANQVFPLWPNNGPIPDVTKVPNFNNTGLGEPFAPLINFLTDDLASANLNQPNTITEGDNPAVGSLSFGTQPTNTVAGQSISTVTVNAPTALNGQQVTLSISPFSQTTGVPLQPSNVVTATIINGVATFNGLSIDTAGTYELLASAPNADSVSSNAFTIVAATATQLGFVQQPTSNWVDGVITPSIRVGAEDQFGNVATSITDSVTLSLASGPANGTMQGTQTVTMVGGIATFGNISFNIAGVYSLLAVDNTTLATTSVVSNAFTIAAPNIRRFLFSGAPVSAAMLAFQERRNAAVLVAIGAPVPAVLSAVVPAVLSASAAPAASNAAAAAAVTSPFASSSLISDSLSSDNRDQSLLQ